MRVNFMFSNDLRARDLLKTENGEVQVRQNRLIESGGIGWWV